MLADRTMSVLKGKNRSIRARKGNEAIGEKAGPK